MDRINCCKSLAERLYHKPQGFGHDRGNLKTKMPPKKSTKLVVSGEGGGSGSSSSAMMDENSPTLTELQGKVNQLEAAVSQQLSPPSIPSPTPLESALKEKLGGESIWHWLWYLLTPFFSGCCMIGPTHSPFSAHNNTPEPTTQRTFFFVFSRGGLDCVPAQGGGAFEWQAVI